MLKVPGFGTIEVSVNEGHTIILKQENAYKGDWDYKGDWEVVFFPHEYAERIIEAVQECVREIESDDG